jgi:putative sigma-54 modulation protein
MQITTTARHCDLDSGLRDFAQQRVSKLEKFARDIHDAHVIVTAEKYRHIAEITIKVDHREMVSREEATDARAAIDLAVDRLEQQLRRLKEKRVERQHSGPDGVERARLTDGVDDGDAAEATDATGANGSLGED